MAATPAADMLPCEADPPQVRHRLLLRMRDEFDRGNRAPELLYLGARWAASLAMDEELERFIGPLGVLAGEDHDALRLLRERPSDRIEVKRVAESLQLVYGAGQARLASVAYEARDLGASRRALEELLLQRGDRADVLWNLLVVVTEQQDVEAYERYWRRFASLQLVRWLRGEPDARGELTRFYTVAAMATDRVFSESSVKVGETLRTPGLLPRWLESHAALAWLGRPRPELCRFWLHAFYPELERYAEGWPSAPSIRPAAGDDDPALKLLTRFAEWSRENFGLENRDDEHAGTVTALAQCVARIAWQPYVQKLTVTLRGKEAQLRPFRPAMQEACSLPLGFRLGRFLDAGDWAGLAEYYDGIDIHRALSPTLRLFYALALCHGDDVDKAFAIAVATLRDMDKDDLAADGQCVQLWKNILQASLHAAAKPPNPDMARVRAIRHALVTIPHTERLRDFLAAREAEVDEIVRYIERDRRVEEVLEASRKHVENKKFLLARAEIHKLDDLAEVRELRDKLFEQVDEAERMSILQTRIDKTIAEARELVEKGQFDAAKRVVRALPDTPKDVKAIKEMCLAQIRDAENAAEHRRRTEALIERAVESAKEHVEHGRFEQARAALRDVPEPLKAQLLGQVNEAAAELRALAEENVTLKRAVRRHGYDDEQLNRLARVNNLDPANPAAMNALLKAIRKQVG